MYNKVTLIGRLTKDVEFRNTTTGKCVSNCSIATSKNWVDESGNKQEKAEFINLVIWGKQAEIFAKYLSKGSKVFIEGELATRSWDDQNTGQKRYATEVNVNNFIFLDTKQVERNEQSTKQVEEKELKIENIPF